MGAEPMTTDILGQRPRYDPPIHTDESDLRTILQRSGRGAMAAKQYDMLDRAKSHSGTIPIYYAGDIDLLLRPCVAVIGARKVSEIGKRRANRFARELAEAGIVVVSGLADGVDTQALGAAMTNGGRVVAVIGTPLDKAYPANNAIFQQAIYRDHLLISQFPNGSRTFQSNFPARNRTMAAVSDGSVIIEASESSGTLHQAVECVKLGRWLGISKGVVDDRRLTWPKKFLSYEKCVVLESTSSFIERVYNK